MKVRKWKNMHSLLLCLVMGFGALLFAGLDRPPVVNEDLRFIIEWQRSQHLTELADRLALSAEQVTTLKQAKAQLDVNHAETEPQIEAARAALAAAARQVRTQLENNGVLTESDQDILREHLSGLRELKGESRRAASETTEGLADLLTDEQRDILQQWFRQRMENRSFEGAFDEDGSFEPHSGAGQTHMLRRHMRASTGESGDRPASGSSQDRGLRRPGNGGHGGKARTHFVRHILLSDAFLSNYE